MESIKRVVRALPFWGWKQYSKLRWGATRWISIYGGQKILVRCDDYRAYRIARQRGTQKEKIRLWEFIAKSTPDVCIDVGANYGEFSSVASELGLRTLVIEANPELVPCLQSSFLKSNSVNVIHSAATDFDGFAPFFFNKAASGSGSMGPHVPIGRTQENSVPAARISSLVQAWIQRQPVSVLMKVDVEGFEESVLDGAETLFDNCVWWRALIEFNHSAIKKAGRNPLALWGKLLNYNGIIIDGSDQRDSALHLSQKLPQNPIENDFDVIVGRGFLPPLNPKIS